MPAAKTLFDRAEHHTVEQEGADDCRRRRHPQARSNFHKRVAGHPSVVENDVRKLVQFLA